MVTLLHSQLPCLPPHCYHLQKRNICQQRTCLLGTQGIHSYETATGSGYAGKVELIWLAAWFSSGSTWFPQAWGRGPSLFILLWFSSSLQGFSFQTEGSWLCFYVCELSASDPNPPHRGADGEHPGRHLAMWPQVLWHVSSTLLSAFYHIGVC